MLADDELSELAEDIRTRGLLHPVWLYEDPERGTVLLDGRNRTLACQLAGVEPRTQQYRGDDPVGFVIAENVRRRHLTTGQKASVAAQAEPLFAEEAKRRQLAALKQNQEAAVVADRPQRMTATGAKKSQKSRDRAAKTAGTSGRSVARYKRVRDQAPDLADQVDKGTLALDRAERIIRDRDAEQRRIEQARAEAELQPEPTRVDIRQGDFRQVLADLTDIDAIITDPPYPREYLPLLGDLAAWADKVLAPDGVLAVLIGQTYLPEVYRLLDGHRPYRWTCAYITSGNGYVSHVAKVQSNWKPLLIYGGGPRMADVVRSEGSDAGAKSLHRWGQDYGAFHTIVERLTRPGQTIVDPFMGAGTTLLAGRALGRHVVGCDVDEAAVATSRERLA